MKLNHIRLSKFQGVEGGSKECNPIPLFENEGEPPRQRRDEIERERNFGRPGFRLGLPTFHFHGYIRGALVF